MYKDQGIDPQQLAGHASAQITDNYDSGHAEIRWIEVKTGLEIYSRFGTAPERYFNLLNLLRHFYVV